MTLERKNEYILLTKFIGYDEVVIQGKRIWKGGRKVGKGHPYNLHNCLVEYSYYKYSESWDWIIPIVRKFNYSIIIISSEYTELCEELEYELIKNYNIEDVYKKAVECVKWYYKEIEK